MNSETEKLIFNSFLNFIIESELAEDKESLTSVIDNAIEAYLVNTIKQLFLEYESHKLWFDNRIEDAFDIDNFVEIIDEYFIGFKRLEKCQILKWLIKLKKSLDDISKNDKNSTVEKSEKISSEESDKCNKETQNSKCKKKKEINDPHLNLLIEMFPSVNLKDINKIYKKTNGNYERAIDNLLVMQQNGSVLDDEGSSSDDADTNDSKEKTFFLNGHQLTDEEKKVIKEKTIKKFGFVEVKEGESQTSCVPNVKWESEKKLIRYYENKVVTTKGEKYFELKSEEDEEKAKEMKKTFINLKPARKYRFH